MKRRGFLGFLGGAAAAGPDVMKVVAEKMPSGLHLPVGMSSTMRDTEATGDGSIGSGSWRPVRIAEIRRFLTGELSEAERERAYRKKLSLRERSINLNVASLRSVSDVRKMEIFTSRHQKHELEIEVLHQRSLLSEFMNQSD